MGIKGKQIGSKTITESNLNLKVLEVTGTTDNALVVNIQGVNGQLFTIKDSLVGDIFTISDITGIPIFNVNSNETITVYGDLDVTSSVNANLLKLQNIVGTNNTNILEVRNNLGVVVASIDGNGNITSDGLEVDGSLIVSGVADFTGSVAINTNPDNNSAGFEYGNGFDPSVYGINYENERFRVNSFFESPFVSMGVAQNYLVYTEDFTNAIWIKTGLGTITSNTVLGPHALLSAENIPGGADINSNLKQTISSSITGDWAAGIWIRAQNGTGTVKLRLDSSVQIGTEKVCVIDTVWRFFGVTENLSLASSTKTFSIINGTTPISLWGSRLNTGVVANAYRYATSTINSTKTPGVFFNNSTVYATTFSGTLSGTATAASYSVSGIYGTSTITNNVNNINQWELLGYITLTYSSTYSYGQSINQWINISEYSRLETDISQLNYENFDIQLNGNLPPANANSTTFNTNIPTFSVNLRGKTNLTNTDIAALVYSSSTTSKVIRLYVKLKTASKNYIITPITYSNLSYTSSFTSTTSNSYISWTSSSITAVIATLPTPIQGSIVYGNIISSEDINGNLILNNGLFVNNIITATSFNSITGLSNILPLVDGVATIGTSSLVSRQDHKHPTDTVLSTSISSEISQRVSSDIHVSTDLSTELSQRISTDTVLSSGLSTEIVSSGNAISTEVSIRLSADTIETTARISVDNSLSTGLSTEITGRTTAITAEASTRLSTDTVLSTGLSTEITGRTTAITAEASIRLSTDISLSTEITNHSIDPIEASIRLSTDISLSTEIINHSIDPIEASIRLSTDNSLSIGLSTTSSQRVSIDVSLSLGLSTEIINRVNNISTEASTRLSTDNFLSTGLSTEITNRGTAITSEASTRLSADTLLSTSLSSEISQRLSSDIHVSTDLSTELSQRISTDDSLTLNVNSREFINNKINTLTNPSYITSTHYPTTLAVKTYVDNIAQGLDTKQSVIVATTATLTISTAPSIIDGITLVLGNRILVKNQTDTTQNGIYVFNGTGSLLTRSTDSDNSGGVTNEVRVGNYVFVENGTTNTGSGWVLSSTNSTDAFITPNVNTQIWTQFSSAGAYTVLATNITSEASIRLSTDNSLSTGLSTGLSTEITNRGTADTAEASSRISTDTVLSSGLSTEIANRNTSDTAESSTRLSTDNSLSSGLSTEITTRGTTLTAETSTRLSTDNYLSTRITTEIANRAAGDTTEASIRLSTDNSLSTGLSTEITNRGTVDTAEASTRLLNDNSLSTGLSTEITNRGTADAAEASTRLSVDSSLSTGLSQRVAADSLVVHLAGTEIITGSKQFTVSPFMGTTTDNILIGPTYLQKKVASVAYTLTLPSNTGTIALTSDIPTYSGTNFILNQIASVQTGNLWVNGLGRFTGGGYNTEIQGLSSDTIPWVSHTQTNYGWGLFDRSTEGDFVLASRNGTSTWNSWLRIGRGDGVATFSSIITAQNGINIISSTTNPSLNITSTSTGSFPVLQLSDGRTGGLSWNIEGGRTNLGNLEFYNTGTRISFSPSGIVTAAQFNGSGVGLTGVAALLAVGYASKLYDAVSMPTLDLNTLNSAGRLSYTRVGAASTNSFTMSDNANAVLTIDLYDGTATYVQQLGFSNNGNFYQRKSNASWNKVYTSGNLTNTLTTNYLSKWNGSSLVNSLISDDGSRVTINTSNNIPLTIKSTIAETYINMLNSTSDSIYGVLLRADGNSFEVRSGNGTALKLRIEGANGNTTINSVTPSTSTSTGALVVSGGLGVSGGVYASSFNGSGVGLTILPVTIFTSANADGGQLRIGGDGEGGGGSLIGSIQTSNGNLHIDSGSAHAMYLNYIQGSGLVNFGGGANNVGATINGSTGNATFNGTLGVKVSSPSETLSILGNIAFGNVEGKAKMIYNVTENSIDFIIN